MYKSKKYAFVCILMIFIIALTVGVSAGFVKEEVKTDIQTNTEQDVVLPPDLTVEEETSNEEDNSVKPPVFNNGFQAIAYANDVLNNGKGFTSYFTQSIRTMGQTQQVSTKRYRSGNLDLAEEWYYIDFAIGENKYKCFYSDNKTMSIKTVRDRNKYNFHDLSYLPCPADELEIFSETDWTGIKGRCHLNDFFLTVNSNTAKVIYFDKSSDKNNYVIKIQMKKDKIDSTYLKIVQDNGASNISFDNLTLTFYVSKKTGYFTKIIKEETMIATYAGFNGIECKNTSTEVFLTMNKDCTQTINEKYALNFIQN